MMSTQPFFQPNFSTDPHRQPQWGVYQYRQGPQVPVQIDQIELSGWAYTPQGPMRFDRSRVIPAQTQLQGLCACPIQWRVGF
jgi:hypothetical protein